MSSLDASVRADLIELLIEMRRRPGAPAMLFITHDLAAAAALADRVLFLDGGRIVTMILPYQAAVKFAELERYGMIILVVLIVSGFLTYFMHPFVWTARRLITWVLI